MQILYSEKKEYDSMPFALVLPWNPMYVDKLRGLKDSLGANIIHWSSDHKAWVFRIEALQGVLDMFGIEEPPESVKTVLQDYNDQLTLDEQMQKQALLPSDIDLPLFKFQKVGISFADTHKRVLIADEMGLGKTVQSIGVIHKNNIQNVLIVCPASLKSNWQIEIKKWIKRESSIIEEGMLLDGICIINYERLEKLEQTLMLVNWGLIVFDESHYLKNPKSKRTKSAKAVAKGCERIILLSGTPILNRPVELISQIEILERMDLFGSSWKFMQTFCNAKQTKWGWDFSGASNLELLQQKLQRFVIRRLKSEVLKDLPEKFVTSTCYDLLNPLTYKKLREKISDDIQQSKNKYKYIYKQYGVSAMGKSQQEKILLMDDLVNNPEYKELKSSAINALAQLRKEIAIQKIEIGKELMEQTNEKIVVFCYHRFVADALTQGLDKSEYALITGATKDRQTEVDKFQNDKNCKYFIGTIGAAGVGLTLTSASRLVFLELDWTPSKMVQAEDRIHRIGQKSNVEITYTYFKDTIEEDIAEMLLGKSDVIERSIRGALIKQYLFNEHGI